MCLKHGSATNKCGVVNHDWFRYDGGCFRMNLGTRLCSYRKRAGMSQQELAEYLKVSRQSVSKWETDVAMPTIDNLQRLGELYGVPIDELINSTSGTMKNDMECIANKHISTIEKQKMLFWSRVAFFLHYFNFFLLIATCFSALGCFVKKLIIKSCGFSHRIQLMEQRGNFSIFRICKR